MIVTVEEAKKIDCCSPAYLSTPQTEETGYCKGDRCMAWEWYTEAYYEDHVKKYKAEKGFCGLAHKP